MTTPQDVAGPRNPAFIPVRELPSRFVCILWHETATEFLDGHVETSRSKETFHIASETLGGLFETIRASQESLLQP